MKKARILMIISVILIAAAIIIIFPILRVPTKTAAAKVNKNIGLPYSLLEPGPGFSSEKFGIISGFGITGYYDLRYSDNTAAETFDVEEKGGVAYYVSAWPDTVLGKSRITRIEIADPDVEIFGCHIGDYQYDFIKAIEKNGFRAKGNNLYECGGVLIRIDSERETGKLKKITVSVNSTNIFRVQY